jgi:hypothetical protein
VGNGASEIANKTAARKAGRPVAEGLARNNGPSEPGTDKSTPQKTVRPRICGAMLQQCADSGTFSAPQKFVQLVGCRDSKLRPEATIRGRPGQLKG